MLCCCQKILKMIKKRKIEDSNKKEKYIKPVYENTTCKSNGVKPQIRLTEIKVADKINDKIEIKIERLYCTHCGYTFPKPEIPVNYIITCEKCTRQLELPSNYYI